MGGGGGGMMEQAKAGLANAPSAIASAVATPILPSLFIAIPLTRVSGRSLAPRPGARKASPAGISLIPNQIPDEFTC
jgi:hypothetical protein